MGVKTYYTRQVEQALASLVAHMIKNWPASGRPGFNPWIGKIPWRREWPPSSVFLPGESHGQRSLAGYSPQGCKESDMSEWLTLIQECVQYFIHYYSIKDSIQNYCNRGDKVNSIPLKQTAGDCLIAGWDDAKTLENVRLVTVLGPSVFTDCPSPEIGSYPHRVWERGVLSFLMFMFQRDGS